MARSKNSDRISYTTSSIEVIIEQEQTEGKDAKRPPPPSLCSIYTHRYMCVNTKY